MQNEDTSDGGDTFEIITDRCRLVADTTEKMGILNTFSYYTATIERLKAMANISFVPVGDICAETDSRSKRLALRHDVDADIVTAVRCARFLADQKIPGAFFILHTSHYYGVFNSAKGSSQFTRHSGFRRFLDQLLETGCEIGIHNDALGVIFDHGGNGTKVFVEELAWLRSCGAVVTGSAAHNSATVYGAEGFEIFKGLTAGQRGVAHWRGQSVNLQTLNMTELGLEYEANHPILRKHLDLGKMRNISSAVGDAIRQAEWQRCYFVDHPVFERGYDYDAWLIGEDAWVLAGKGDVRFPVTLDGLVQALDDLPPCSRIVLSIHPIYVGKRQAEEEDAETAKSTSALTKTFVSQSVPSKFGFWWEKEESDLNWYDWMFQYRLGVHRRFLDWLGNAEASSRFDSVLEVGCGRGVFYPHFFSDRRYSGLEYSKRNTEWLTEKRQWQLHSFHNGDIASWRNEEKFDLVFSSGTIDNVPDMDAFLKGVVRNAKKKIYLTAYRGWFPDLENHLNTWSGDTGAYYNDISPKRVWQVLEEVGCANIQIEPLPTGRPEIPFETLIIADVRG
jgi:Methyltransferase domain